MSTIKQTENEIRKGKNLTENIPVFVTRMASLYGEFSYLNLAMQLSLLAERNEEDGNELNKHNKEIYDELLEILQLVTSDSFDPDSYKTGIEKLIALRETIRHRMEAVTNYVDKLVLYEYMLKRLSSSFETVEIERATNDELAGEILRWIFGTSDNAVINERIRTVCSCLPVRLTKSKILDMVDSVFSLYNGSDKKALDNFDYMLRSASGLIKSDEKYDIYENVKEMLDELENADYSALDERKYWELKDDHRLSASSSQDLADELEQLMGLTNSVLAVLLTRQYFSFETETRARDYSKLISEILSGNDDYDALFKDVEGKVEELSEQIQDEESVIAVINSQYSDVVSQLLLDTPMKRLFICSRLCSESTFAELADDLSKTEYDYLMNLRQAFKDDLTKLMSNSNKLMNRAITAQLLLELPVMMSSRNEVMDYVKNALMNCRDDAERQVSVNLIRDCYGEF